MKNLLKHSPNSYFLIFLVGIAVGCICRLADYCPADSLWGFSSIQTLLGFWIITNTMIVLASSSNLCAGISSFLYLFGMTLSFYGLKTILGLFLPKFSGPFQTGLFMMFTIAAIPCAIAAFILYFWNRDTRWNGVLYALPVGALLAEAIATTVFVCVFHQYLFQVIMDIAGVLIFSLLFWNRTKSKPLYSISIILSTLLFYFLMWHQELTFWLHHPELL